MSDRQQSGKKLTDDNEPVYGGYSDMSYQPAGAQSGNYGPNTGWNPALAQQQVAQQAMNNPGGFAYQNFTTFQADPSASNFTAPMAFPAAPGGHQPAYQDNYPVQGSGSGITFEQYQPLVSQTGQLPGNALYGNFPYGQQQYQPLAMTEDQAASGSSRHENPTGMAQEDELSALSKLDFPESHGNKGDVVSVTFGYLSNFSNPPSWMTSAPNDEDKPIVLHEKTRLRIECRVEVAMTKYDFKGHRYRFRTIRAHLRQKRADGNGFFDVCLRKSQKDDLQAIETNNYTFLGFDNNGHVLMRADLSLNFTLLDDIARNSVIHVELVRLRDSFIKLPLEDREHYEITPPFRGCDFFLECRWGTIDGPMNGPMNGPGAGRLNCHLEPPGPPSTLREEKRRVRKIECLVGGCRDEHGAGLRLGNGDRLMDHIKLHDEARRGIQPQP